MKNLFIGLLAFALTLGVSCKKEELSKKETKKELTIKKFGDIPAESGIGGYPGGADTYPHSTGACYCGKYSVCHPVPKHMGTCTGYRGGEPCNGCWLPY